MNCKANNHTLTIPKGNDFRLHLCSIDIVPGMQEADFSLIEGLQAYIVAYTGKRDKVQHIIQGADIIIEVPAQIQRWGDYDIEITGEYQGHPWRWKAKNVFRIINYNPEASHSPIETFGVETYYIRDVVWVQFDGETMTLISDGHVSIHDDVLELQDTEDTTFEIEGNTLYITTKN